MQSTFDPELSFEAMEAAAQPGFGAWLLAAAQRFADIEEIYAYRFTRAGGPRALVSTGDDPSASDRAALYASRFHPYDPMLQGVKNAPEARFMQVFADDITNKDYRDICFDQPRFVDKLSFRWVRPNETFFVSFYRRKTGSLQSLETLGKLADVGLSSLVHNTQRSAGTKKPLSIRLRGQLAAKFPALTSRELDVCALSLCGISAREIARRLNVGHATVLTYRQRAYGKYGFTKASDFLDSLIAY